MSTVKNLEYIELVGEEAIKLDTFFHGKKSTIEVNPGGVIMPKWFKEIGDKIHQMPVYDTDVWVCSFPRTGSTWASEMVWLIGNDLDYEKAKKLQRLRCPFVEITSIVQIPEEDRHKEVDRNISVNLVKNMPHPRYVRSHLPWSLLPADFVNEDNTVKPKIVYTTRNPKDVCVSYYYHWVLMHNMKCTLEEFCDLFLNEKVPVGSFWKHVFGFWEWKDDPNVLFLKYEDMKKDLPSVIRQTAKFLGKTISDSEVEKLKEHLSFKSIKNNKAVNYDSIIEMKQGKEYLERTNLRYIRKGEIGDWKNNFSEEMSKKFDEWIEKNLNKTSLSFD